MKLDAFSRTRVWAALTGVVLALWFLVGVALGQKPPLVVPTLATAIGGFELALWGYDLWLRRRRRHG